MGFLDELKDKAEEFGDKAQEGFGAAKDKTEEVIENVKDRFDGDETPAEKDVAAEPVTDGRRRRLNGRPGFRPEHGRSCWCTRGGRSFHPERHQGGAERRRNQGRVRVVVIINFLISDGAIPLVGGALT